MQLQSALAAADARVLTDQIKVAVEATWELVKRAYVERAWAVLGYESWDDYCTREFGTSRLRLPREERSEVVASLRESGLSTRAIAAATGLGKGTVDRALSGAPNGAPEITGTDGKTYTRPRPVPAPEVDNEPDIDAEIQADPRFMSDTDLAELNTPQRPPVVDAVPQQAPAPRRKPITDAFDSANLDVRRAVERVVRLAGDDRFTKNKDKIKASNLSDLVRVRDALNGVINQLEG